jgi:PKD repeat protein
MKQIRASRTWPTLVLTAAVLSCTDRPSTMEPDLDILPQMARTAAATLPPIADAGDPYTGEAGVAIRFDGSGSSDPDGPKSKLKYSWNFGDGSTGSGKGPSHIYAAKGTYDVTLTVTDGSGMVSEPATTTATVSPPNQKPVANPGGPYTASPGVAVQLDGSKSEDPDGNTPLTYAWNFGDKKSGTGATPSHTYAKAGTYTVTLTVKDAKGLSSSPVTTTVIVASGSATNLLMADGFSRTVNNGWGTANVGGAWYVDPAGPVFKVDGSRGIMELQQLDQVNAVGRDLKTYGLDVGGLTSFSVDRAPDDSTSFHTVQVYARRNDRLTDGDNYYRYRVRMKRSGKMDVRMEKNVAGTRSFVIPENVALTIRFTPGTKYWIRWEAFGASPTTTVRMRVWQDGTTEPTTWDASAVVAERALDASGTTGIHFEGPQRQINWPVRLSVDDLQYYLLNR